MATKDAALAYESIIGKLKIKLQRQMNAVTETTQHISAIEALRDTAAKAKAEPTK